MLDWREISIQRKLALFSEIIVWCSLTDYRTTRELHCHWVALQNLPCSHFYIIIYNYYIIYKIKSAKITHVKSWALSFITLLPYGYFVGEILSLKREGERGKPEHLVNYYWKSVPKFWIVEQKHHTCWNVPISTCWCNHHHITSSKLCLMVTVSRVF